MTAREEISKLKKKLEGLSREDPRFEIILDRIMVLEVTVAELNEQLSLKKKSKKVK